MEAQRIAAGRVSCPDKLKSAVTNGQRGKQPACHDVTRSVKDLVSQNLKSPSTKEPDKRNVGIAETMGGQTQTTLKHHNSDATSNSHADRTFLNCHGRLDKDMLQEILSRFTGTREATYGDRMPVRQRLTGHDFAIAQMIADICHLFLDGMLRVQNREKCA
jgi:hypothetical protein